MLLYFRCKNLEINLPVSQMHAPSYSIGSTHYLRHTWQNMCHKKEGSKDLICTMYYFDFVKKLKMTSNNLIV